MDAKNVREIVKLLLIKENMSLTRLAELLSEKTKKKVYQQTLSLKLIKNTLKFEEMLEICEVLGYKIDFIKIA